MEWKPTPTPKAPAIEGFLAALNGVHRCDAIERKTCATCGASVTLDSFKDELSLKEFHISAMCQTCQDSVFG